MHSQPPRVFLEGAATKPCQVIGFLESDTAFHRCAQHLVCKQLADTRVLVVVEIATSGRLATSVFSIDVVVVETKKVLWSMRFRSRTRRAATIGLTLNVRASASKGFFFRLIFHQRALSSRAGARNSAAARLHHSSTSVPPGSKDSKPESPSVPSHMCASS